VYYFHADSPVCLVDNHDILYIEIKGHTVFAGVICEERHFFNPFNRHSGPRWREILALGPDPAKSETLTGVPTGSGKEQPAAGDQPRTPPLRTRRRGTLPDHSPGHPRAGPCCNRVREVEPERRLSRHTPLTRPYHTTIPRGCSLTGCRCSTQRNKSKSSCARSRHWASPACPFAGYSSPSPLTFPAVCEIKMFLVCSRRMAPRGKAVRDACADSHWIPRG
jgi:hypothetical protein